MNKQHRRNGGAFGLLLFAASSLMFLPTARAAGLQPVHLSCEYKVNPLAIDAPHPRLFWQVVGAGRGRRQTAYQVWVAKSEAELDRGGALWDSGKVASADTIQIAYRGKPLVSSQQTFWKVRVWDEAGTVSAWSKPASWSMGLLRPNDWRAKWIAYPAAPSEAATLAGASWIWHNADGANPPKGTRYLRTTVTLPANLSPTGAKLLISADDQYSFSINGGAMHTGPRGTDSWRRYQAFDVTRELRPGANQLLVQAENGEPSPAGIVARLQVMGKERTQSFVSDGSWETATSADGPFAPARVVGAYGTAPWGRITSTNDEDRTPPTQFRKSFAVNKPVRRAVLYATALGVYELSCNGQRVGKDVLSPGWTDFHKRVHYLAYDVTPQIRQGKNVLGAVLGDGWYASYIAFTGRHHLYGGDPCLRSQLRIEFVDGTTQTIGTDETWKAAYGPVLRADLLQGCVTDTRREMPGWNAPGFDDAKWRFVVAASAPAIAVEAQPNEPIRPNALLTARARREPAPNVYVYDLGQNLSGWARLTVRQGKPGQMVTVRYGERLNPDGTLYTTNLRGARATDTFVLSGGTQTLEPRFTFHGFQYVEVTGIDAPLPLDQVVAVAVSSDLAPALAFDSDNPLLNKLSQNIDWSFRDNALDVPTDCPQRDERAGWTGDAQVFAKTAMLHRNAAPFFSKWLQDLEDGQRDDGAYPDVAPSFIGGGNAGWEDAAVVCTYRMYEMYGDTTLVRRMWPSLTRYMAHLARVAPDGVRAPGSYGDWLLLHGPQLSAIHGTAYYFRCASLMAQLAQSIGETEDTVRYRALAEKIRTVFNDRFVSADGRILDKGQDSQTFYALALEWDMLPTEKRASAGTRLGELLQAQGLATGFLGTPVLLSALASENQADKANALLLSETYPSWLYQIKQGATTTWERWDGWTPERGFQDPGMNSFNHYWLGCVGEWMYTGLVGLDTDGPSWKKLVVRPQTDGPLKRARVRYDSVNGPVEGGWEKNEDGSLVLRVSVPANVQATVYVPASDATKVTEGGKPVSQSSGVSFVRQEPRASVFTVGSGQYTFVVKP